MVIQAEVAGDLRNALPELTQGIQPFLRPGRRPAGVPDGCRAMDVRGSIKVMLKRSGMSASGRKRKSAPLAVPVAAAPVCRLSQHQNRWSTHPGAKFKVDQRPHSAARPRIPLGEKIQAPVRTPASAVQRIAWTRQCLSLQTGGVRGQGQIALRSCAATSVRTPQAAPPERKDSLGQTRRQ